MAFILVNLPPSKTFPSIRMGDYIAKCGEDGIVDSALIGQSEHKDPDDWSIDPLCDVHVSRLDMASEIKNARVRSEAALASAPVASSQEVADISTTVDGPTNNPS